MKKTLTSYIGIGDKIINPQNELNQDNILYVIDRSVNYQETTLLCSEGKFTVNPNTTRVKFTNIDYPEIYLLDSACN